MLSIFYGDLKEAVYKKIRRPCPRGFLFVFDFKSLKIRVQCDTMISCQKHKKR